MITKNYRIDNLCIFNRPNRKRKPAEAGSSNHSKKKLE
jgi:hypothetical protein